MFYIRIILRKSVFFNRNLLKNIYALEFVGKGAEK